MTATKPKERPIVMSEPEVKAVLAGRKTQTRVIVFKNDPLDCHMPWRTPSGWQDGDDRMRCPFVVGTHLWVREAWQLYRGFGESTRDDAPVLYRTDVDHCGRECPVTVDGESFLATPRDRWQPRSRMPSWCSRITLEITDVRVERVQSTSEADAQAEGTERFELTDGLVTFGDQVVQVHPMTDTYVNSFARAWDSIHGPGAWERNDWVWCVTFRRLETP